MPELRTVAVAYGQIPETKSTADANTADFFVMDFIKLNVSLWRAILNDSDNYWLFLSLIKAKLKMISRQAIIDVFNIY